MLLFRDNAVTAEDLKTVRDIVASTGFFEGAPDEIDIAVELVQEALDKGCSPETYCFLFLEDGGKTIGYSCYARTPCTLGTFGLYWIVVHNDRRDQGLGKILMNQTVDRIKKLGASKVVAETSGREQYLPTRKFYESCGFKLEASLKDFYAEGDDCLFYTMDFYEER